MKTQFDSVIPSLSRRLLEAFFRNDAEISVVSLRFDGDYEFHDNITRDAVRKACEKPALVSVWWHKLVSQRYLFICLLEADLLIMSVNPMSSGCWLCLVQRIFMLAARKRQRSTALPPATEQMLSACLLTALTSDLWLRNGNDVLHINLLRWDVNKLLLIRLADCPWCAAISRRDFLTATELRQQLAASWDRK